MSLPTHVFLCFMHHIEHIGVYELLLYLPLPCHLTYVMFNMYAMSVKMIRMIVVYDACTCESDVVEAYVRNFHLVGLH